MNASVSDKTFFRRVMIVIAVIGVVILLVYTGIRITSLIVIGFAAWITSETLDISVRYLMRRKLPRWAAVTITMLVVILLITAIVTIIAPPVAQELVNLIDLVRRLPEVITDITENYEAFRAAYPLVGNILPPAPDGLPRAFLGDGGFNNIVTRLEQAIPLITNIGAYIGTVLAKIILYLFLTVLIMLEPEVYYDALVLLLPARLEARAREIITLVRKNVESWSGAMLLSIAITSLLYTIVLGVILQLPDALALSVIAGIATIIPTVGNTLALIPVIIVAAPLGLTRVLLAIGLYMAVGTIQDRVVTPAIMRTELSIPVALLIFFQLTLATLIGPVGLVLAVPLLAILITLVREIYVYDVLGKKPVPEKTDDEANKKPEPEEPAAG